MHINTHEAFKQLVDAGVKEKAAETIIKVIDEARKSDFSHLATKEDIAIVKSEIIFVKGEIILLKWMLGFLLAMSSAIILKLFG